MKALTAVMFLVLLAGCVSGGSATDKQEPMGPTERSYEEIAERIKAHGEQAILTYEAILDAHFFLSGPSQKARLDEICGLEGCHKEYPVPDEDLASLVINYERIRLAMEDLKGNPDFFELKKAARIIQGSTYAQLPKTFIRESGRVSGLIAERCRFEQNLKAVEWCEQKGWR